MKCNLKPLFKILLMIALLSPSMQAFTKSNSWSEGDKLVAAYFFYWYDIYTNRHFIDPDGSDALTDHPPDSYLNDYSYTDVNWHRRELLDMLSAGVDIVLPVYWGSDQETIWSVVGLQNLVIAEQQLLAEGIDPPKIGMFYDTTALQQQNGGVPPDLTTTPGKMLFYDMLADFFNLVPESLWAMIDNQPVVWLYVSNFVSAYDQGTFDYTNQHFQSDFGTTPYIVRELSWDGIDTAGSYYWGVALNGAMTSGQVGSLGPGYDESAVYNRPDPQTRDRQCGEFYTDSWESIISSGASLVGLETWNEFHEGTDIAPSLEYSTTYLTLTAENVTRWKESDYSKASLVWLDFGNPSYQQGLGPAFNTGDGTWKTAFIGGRQAVYPDNHSDPESYYVYLAVNDAFISAQLSEVWVTVEYYDTGSGQWSLQYDSLNDPHKSLDVLLQDTGKWQRHTFHLTDAYFGGRQNLEADLRLADNAWWDSQTDYFGRVWISKQAPSNQAPDLLNVQDIGILAGGSLQISLNATDPDINNLTLNLERSPSFASLENLGGGRAILHLKPKSSMDTSCTYILRVIAIDNGSPPLSDAATFRLSILSNGLFLPLLLCY